MTLSRHITMVARAPLLALLLSACTSTRAPVETVEYVDLERFMGDWYVIASIPTALETDAYNAVENYRLTSADEIATTFTFRKGAFDGPEKTYHPKGFIRDAQSNAEWGMQFVWPIKADYRISWLNADYSQVVIARNKRDYVWIMARDPEIPAEDYDAMIAHVVGLGYDAGAIRPVPQRWPQR